MSPIMRYYLYYSSILHAKPVRFCHYYPRVSVSSTPSWLNLMLKDEPLSFQTCLNDHTAALPFAGVASIFTM